MRSCLPRQWRCAPTPSWTTSGSVDRRADGGGAGELCGNTLGLKKTALKTEFPRVGEAPFDSMRKMMSTLHQARTAGSYSTPRARRTRCIAPLHALSQGRARAAHDRERARRDSRSQQGDGRPALCACWPPPCAPRSRMPATTASRQTLEQRALLRRPGRHDRPRAPRGGGSDRRMPAARASARS